MDKFELKARELDAKDALSDCREMFHIPKHRGKDAIYLCGNSLGLQPKKVGQFVQQELDDWAKLGVEGHFQARTPWMPYHEVLTDQMAKVVGAKPIETVVMNSLTVNLHLLMASFYRPTKERFKIVMEQDAFPSDRYAVESQLKWHGLNPKESLVIWQSKPDKHTLDIEELESIFHSEGDSIALLFIGGVNYYTGQNFDIKQCTDLAHKHGAVAGFDLAHAAGNIDLKLHDSGADFAAWCTYKYMNSGPGGLSGVFVHERHADNQALPRLAGWWGHNKETRFNMRHEFDPIPGAEGWQLSNPPILPMAALRASLEIFDKVPMVELRKKALALSQYLLDMIDSDEQNSVEVITPRDDDKRGCQLSLLVHGSNKSIFNKITDEGVIADWREPDVIRIATVPLYNSFHDVWSFWQVLKRVMS